jgi:predicted O-methyltransferase YrrM
VSQLEQITPVPILQREGEFDVLLDMYAKRKPKRVLEIGTYHGGTLYHWLQNAQPGTLVVSLDSYPTEVDNRYLFGEWIPEGVQLDVIEGDSRDSAIIESVRRQGPYDWIFIDAGHFYEEVSADWLNYGAMCAKGGLVGFHDILYSDVARLWEEIKAEHETREIISDPITEWHGWCGIGCVLM